MNENERRIIDDLFAKLREAERRSDPRDPEAEALIRRHVADQPAAPYYMAQAIVVQEQALANLHERVQELERRLAERPAGGGGFLSGLFGGGGGGGGASATASGQAAAAAQRPQIGAYPGYHRAGGGGFLAGAMQTAVGVAGGVLVANALASAFAPDEAAAAEPAAEEPAVEDTGGFEEDAGGFDDLGGFEEF